MTSQVREKSIFHKSETGIYIDVPESIVLPLGIQAGAEGIWYLNERNRMACLRPLYPSLSNQELAVYDAVLRAGVGSITGKVYQQYIILAKERQLHELTSRRVTGIIKKLNTRNLIRAEVVSYGRWGRTQIVKEINREINRKSI